MTFEISALAVTIPLGTSTLAFVLWRESRRGKLTLKRVALLVIACVYGVGLLKEVLLPYPIVLGAARGSLPPWEVFVQLIPLVNVPVDPSGMILNIVLFIPFGAIVPLFLHRLSFARVLAFGAAVSLAIEIVQLLGDLTVSTARVGDIDDLIGNTAGTAIGFGLGLVVRRLIRTKKQMIDLRDSRRPATLDVYPTPSETHRP